MTSIGKDILRSRAPPYPPHMHIHTHIHTHTKTQTHTHKDMKGFNFSRLQGCFFATSKTNRWLKKLLAVCRYVFPDVHAVRCFPEQRVESIEQYHRVLFYLNHFCTFYYIHEHTVTLSQLLSVYGTGIPCILEIGDAQFSLLFLFNYIVESEPITAIIYQVKQNGGFGLVVWGWGQCLACW